MTYKFWYLCQWAPAVSTGFLLVTFSLFQTSLRLEKLWIFQVGQATFKYGLAVQSKNHKNSLHSAGMLILFESFLGILPLNPLVFFHHLVPHVCQAFDKLKILERRFGTQDTLKKVIYLSISLALFLLLCLFHMNLNIQNSLPYRLSTYSWQFSTGIWSDQQIPGWTQFF